MMLAHDVEFSGLHGWLLEWLGLVCTYTVSLFLFICPTVLILVT